MQYLGVRLDCNMSGDPHARELIAKCNTRVSFLFRYSSLLDNNTRRILCTALVQPLLDYCCSSWYSGLSRILQERINVIQRRMVRFIFSYDSRHVDSRDLRRLSWMSIPERVGYFKLLHVFKIRNNLAPDYLSNRFTLIEQTHQHNTRQFLYLEQYLRFPLDVFVQCRCLVERSPHFHQRNYKFICF